MQFVANVLEFAQDLINEFAMRLQLLLFEGSEFDPNDHFLQDVIVGVVFLCALLPFFELLFELEVESEGFGVDLVQVGQEVLAEILVVSVE